MRALKAGGLLLILVVAVAAIGGGASAQNGYQYPSNPKPGLGPKPRLKLVVKRTSTKVARTKGIRVGATCNVACVVSVRLVKGAKVLGKRTKVLPRKSGTLRIKLNKAGKRALKNAKRTFRFRATGRAEDATNQRSSVATANAKIVKPRRN